MTDFDTRTASRRPSPGSVQAALGLGAFAIGSTEFATMSLLPAFSQGLSVDAPTGGHVISAYALGVVVGAPLFAVFGARLSRRTLLVLMMIWFALGNGLSAFAPNFESLVALRFLTGLPHGAYFGIAALVAAAQVAPEQRTAAVGRVMLGLTTATIVGVPLANVIGQELGWRWAFAAAAALALLTVALVTRLVPADRQVADASPLRELGALRNSQVWLTLGVGAVGFGGMFAVYSYLTSTLAEVTHAPAWSVPLVLAVFGVGLTLGNLVAPRFAARGLMPTAGWLLVWSAIALALYTLATPHLWSITLAVAAVGGGGGLAAILQTRLMDVAGHGQGLAAALNHSAFNIANALGPWLGGAAIAAGYGWSSTGWVGCGMALGGLAILAVAMVAERRSSKRSRQAPVSA